jgi:hypothetical protein
VNQSRYYFRIFSIAFKYRFQSCDCARYLIASANPDLIRGANRCNTGFIRAGAARLAVMRRRLASLPNTGETDERHAYYT